MIAIIVIAVIVVVYFGLAIYGAKETMEIERLPLTVAASSTGLKYEDVSFKSRDESVVMKGWHFPGGGDSVIVIVHGGYQNRVDDNVNTLGLTVALVDEGYSVLLFDQRGRGESENKGLALSYIDQDIGGAVDFLKDNGYPLKKICLMGFCSGAVSSCIYASRNDIGTLILDGCLIDIPTMVVRQAAAAGPPELLARLFIPGLHLMTKIFYGYELINPIDVVGEINCPVLFIHEENDEFIKEDEIKRLFEASTNPASEMWEISNVEHSRAFQEYPEEYVTRIDCFIKKNAKDYSVG